MTAIDASTAQQHAVPAPTEGPAPAGDTARPTGYIGRHRAGGRHHHTTVRPVDVSHRLTPAARQWVAPTPEDQAVHAGVDDDTGLYRLDDIQHARTEGPTP